VELPAAWHKRHLRRQLLRIWSARSRQSLVTQSSRKDGHKQSDVPGILKRRLLAAVMVPRKPQNDPAAVAMSC